jgi:hypothetical protein
MQKIIGLGLNTTQYGLLQEIINRISPDNIIEEHDIYDMLSMVGMHFKYCVVTSASEQGNKTFYVQKMIGFPMEPIDKKEIN